ncbi:UPF0755 protein [Pullulanibacillus pueri]|uniref:Endolytic murein transglycosylase n=1 Tax=Pullulanibacillus pueri TaxID=1437324 RepID=A0A8J3EN77_9BACL|nr:endolytic transglycosylase MltG [Pullulanibacillus pueri]MBM7683239.1 UPF0755 protein [Pullulanibacillus pueri]GGH85696.1 hypothetical protein GCM10007096_31680 [Pullulanibacillus pueri]
MGDSKDRFQVLRERAEEARLVRRIVFIVVCSLVILFVGGATFTYYYISHSLAPVSSTEKKKVVVNIPSGSSTEDISKILESKGVIRNSTIFHYYVKYKNKNNFQAGVYQLSPGMTIDDIIGKIESGDVYTNAALKLAIPEGYKVSDITKRIAEKTKLTEKEINKKLNDRNYIKEHYMKKYPFLTDAILNKQIKSPLEGYLFPATYNFDKKNPDLDTIIDKMLSKTQTILEKYNSQIQNNSLGSVHKILSMASIVEREAEKDDDRKKVAAVFYNRLDSGMKLQSDITVLYALGKTKAKVYQKDTEIDSPYNTYVQKGLPVGPINNPSESSIAAVLEPAHTKALFFYARPNGEILFTDTLAEHNKVVNKYSHEWDDVKGE